MELQKNAEHIILELQSKGYQAFVVGGCVRDALLGKVPNDWDICTSALPEEIKSVFSNHRTIDVGIAHGTVSVIIDKESFEVTTYRTDGEYLDNRRPKKVEFVSNLTEDLLRRDFTINAMAYNHTEGLVDVCGGQQDLQNRVIRTVGDAKIRFSEDALRMVRALRFSSSLGFEIEEETQRAIYENKSLLRKIAIERSNVEFTKMILSQHFASVLKMHRSVVAEFFPIIKNVSDSDIDFASNLTSDTALRLSSLLKNCDFDGVCKALKNMKYPNKICNSVMAVLSNVNGDYGNDVALKKLIGKIGVEDCVKLLSVQGNQHLIVKVYDVTEKCQCVSIKDLNINGTLLIELGFDGVSIGKTLNVLLDKVIVGELNNEKEELLSYAKQYCFFSL